jgi:hypothetical protein
MSANDKELKERCEKKYVKDLDVKRCPIYNMLKIAANTCY